MKWLISLMLILSVFVSVSAFCVETGVDAQNAINSIDLVLNSKTSQLSDGDRGTLIWAKERLHYVIASVGQGFAFNQKQLAFSNCVANQMTSGADHYEADNTCLSLLGYQ
jgi:hypothetical protein